MICAVLVNYKQTEKTNQCLTALNSMSVLPDWVIVVDNGSTEKTKSKLLSGQYRFKTDFIFNSENRGFAAACNQGILLAQSSGASYDVWLLNNDTIPEKDALKELSKKATETGAGVTGSAIYTPNGTFSGGAGKTHSLFATVSRIKGPQDTDFDYIEGASFLISHNCLNKTGMFSEDYFLYYEENDYCHRATKNGFSLALATDSIIKHSIGSSTGSEIGKGQTPFFVDCLMVRNRILFAKKFRWSKLGYCFGLLISLLLRLKRRQFNRVIAICKITASQKQFRRFIAENGGWIEP